MSEMGDLLELSKRQLGIAVPDYLGYSDIRVDYHRNGSLMQGFHVILVTSEIDGQRHRMLITVFENEDGTNQDFAVIDVDKAAAGIIGFVYNSWRGDRWTGVVAHAKMWHRHLWDIQLYGKCYRCEDKECEAEKWMS